MTTQKGGRYGLVLKKSAANSATRLNPSVFHGDADSDEDLSQPSKQSTNTTKIRRQDEVHIRKALEEDKSVFQYDEVYEDIQNAKDRVSQSNKQMDSERKPKYIPQLIKAAQIRNREYEARVERQQQIERQKEGDMFADKETFVTKAYRDKMERINEYEMEQKRREQIENAMDVTKQRDLSGFYRHFLNDTYGSAEPSSSVGALKTMSSDDASAETTKVKDEPPDLDEDCKPKIDKSSKVIKPKRTIYSDDSDEDEKPPPVAPKPGLISKPKTISKEVTLIAGSRHYKRRRESSSSSGEDGSPRRDARHRRRSSSEESIGEAYLKHKSETVNSTRRRQEARSPSPEIDQTHASRQHRKSAADKGPERNHEEEIETVKRKKQKDNLLINHATGRSVSPPADKPAKNENESAGVGGTSEKQTVEQRLAKLKKIFGHRNDSESIAEMRERYLERKAAREM